MRKQRPPPFHEEQLQRPDFQLKYTFSLRSPKSIYTCTLSSEPSPVPVLVPPLADPFSSCYNGTCLEISHTHTHAVTLTHTHHSHTHTTVTHTHVHTVTHQPCAHTRTCTGHFNFLWNMSNPRPPNTDSL